MRKAADSNYVEGYEMQKEAAEESESGGMSFSGADILGTLFVVIAAGGIYLGFRKKKF
jgi:cobaltochelatase CobN